MFINGDEEAHGRAPLRMQVNHIRMKHPVNWIGIYPDRHISASDIGFSQIPVPLPLVYNSRSRVAIAGRG